MSQIKSVAFPVVGGVTAFPSEGFAYDGVLARSASNYDGTNDYVSWASAVHGVGDSAGAYLISFWINPENDADEYVLAFGNRVFIRRKTNGQFILTGKTSGNVVIVAVEATTGVSALDTWCHVVFSGVPGSEAQVYVDGEDALGAASTNDAGTLRFEETLYAGATGGGTPSLTGSLSEVYITQPATFFDLSAPGNIDKFITATGSPESLGYQAINVTGSVPQIYLPDGGLSNNHGAGGQGTIVGPPTSARPPT